MKTKRIIKIQNAILPNKLSAKPLAESQKMNRLRKYVQGLNPEIDEMKKLVLGLFNRRKVQERIEKMNIEGLIEESQEFFTHLNKSPEYGLLVIGAGILGIKFNDNEKSQIVFDLAEENRYSSFFLLKLITLDKAVYFSSTQKKKQELIICLAALKNHIKSALKILSIIEDIIKNYSFVWGNFVSEDRFRLIVQLFEFSENGHLKVDEKRRTLAYVFEEIYKRKKTWEKLTADSIQVFENSIVQQALVWTVEEDNEEKQKFRIESAICFLDFLEENPDFFDFFGIEMQENIAGQFIYPISSMKNLENKKKRFEELIDHVSKNKRTWKKIKSEHQKILLSKFFNSKPGSGFEFFEFLEKAFENGFDINGFFDYAKKDQGYQTTDNILSKVNLMTVYVALRRYVKEISNQEIDSMQYIQEIIKYAAMFNPDDFLEDAEDNFSEVSREQFCFLCAELAKVNPELVQAVGRKLEQTIWRDAA